MHGKTWMNSQRHSGIKEDFQTFVWSYVDFHDVSVVAKYTLVLVKKLNIVCQTNLHVLARLCVFSCLWFSAQSNQHIFLQEDSV